MELWTQQMKIEAMNVKVSAMTDEEKEAPIQEIYALPTDQLIEDDTAEFFAIMFGG